MHWAAVASQIAMAAQSAAAPTRAPPAEQSEPTTLRAQSARRPSRPQEVSRAPTSSVRGEAYAGYAGSIALGGDFLARYRLFEAGGLCQAMAFSLATTSTGCALLLGISPRSPTYSHTWGVGVDLLGVVGARHWKGVGHDEFLDSDPGGSATLPFAGLRAGASFYLDPFVFSFWLGVDDDIGRTHVTYTYKRSTLLGDTSTPAQGAADVGAVTWLAAWRTGVQYDLP